VYDIIIKREKEKLRSVNSMKKFFKFLGVLAAIAAAAAAVYVVLQKVKAKNAPESYDEDNYVSCSCLEDDFISETVAE
jgi:negative regulator of sigma E activity